MKFIQPNVEIWDIYSDNLKKDIIDDLWSHIARCTRVCYQSERKDYESDKDFVKRTILAHNPTNSPKNHLAMLEHGSVYLCIPFDSVDYSSCYIKYFNNKYTRINKDVKYLYISTNLRVLVENEWLADMQYATIPTDLHIPQITFNIITDIGVSRELNRHRCHSIAEESTRCCNYSKDKFNNNIKYSIPSWSNIDNNKIINTNTEIARLIKDLYQQDDSQILELWSDIDFYISALTFAEWHYNMLIKCGWKAQQARQVLPLGTKTQLVHTAFVDDWIKFVQLRSEGISGAPHPNMKVIADKIKQILIDREFIKDQMPR